MCQYNSSRPNELLWNFMPKVGPFHIMIHGGDQIYSDLPFDFIWQLPLLKGFWKGGDTTKTSWLFTDPLREQLDDFFFNMYRKHWSQPGVANILATCPSIMMWDDHDIFDGYGSYSDNLQACPTFKGIFRIARKYFRYFQLGCNEKELPVCTMPNQDVFSQVYYLNGIAIASIDMRSERKRKVILSDKTWAAFSKYLGSLKSVKVDHFFLLSGVPVMYNNFAGIEQLVGGIGKLKTMEIEDDLIDHWGHDKHSKEREKLLDILYDFCTTRKVRCTILSGDVHVGGVGVIEKKGIKSNLGVINNLISSAIGSLPPSSTAVTMLDIHARMRTNAGKDIVGGLHEFVSSKTKSHSHFGHRNFMKLERMDDGSISVCWYLEKPNKGEKGVKMYTMDIKPLKEGKGNMLDVDYK
eukprot:TRINITY_DN9157_c0_g1_i1.p1 TRINITY_DN9157_c0_g1~~TRINITY_DN9157_c0_g1_i1.p1  ORF type:complete len:409 (+),score=57.63 TRINITY_DN9157_c0_g1_i1:71-1297(+)